MQTALHEIHQQQKKNKNQMHPGNFEPNRTAYVMADSGRVVSYVVRVQLSPDDMATRSIDFRFKIRSSIGEEFDAKETARFVGPRWVEKS